MQTVIDLARKVGRLSATGPSSKAGTAPAWNARFEGKEGWIGGDGAASVDLGSGRILWLFGDTIWGKVTDHGRSGAAMVNNTIGLQAGKDGAIRFIAGKTSAGKPAAFFTPADGKGWFWPHAAVMDGGRLCIFVMQITKTDAKGVFGFKQVGEWLLEVANPGEEPEKWRLEQHKIPIADFNSKRERTWGAAILTQGNYQYIYGYEEPRARALAIDACRWRGLRLESW